jgi:putative ABC transport system permease protein
MIAAVVADLRTAWRAALHQPAFTVVVVATLAIGIGTTTAIFAILHAALLKPLPYAEPDRLVLARRTVDGAVRMWNSAPDYYDYREQTDAFRHFARMAANVQGVTIAGGERPERVAATRVSEDFFTTFGVAPVAGRSFTAEESRTGAPYVLMVSERLARRRFGEPGAALGRTLTVTGIAPGSVAATIVGVVPDSFRFLEAADAWTAIRRGEGDGPATRQFHNWIIVARMKPGVTIEAAQQQADVVSARLQQLYPATNKNKALRLDPLQAAIFQPQTPRLWTLMGAVALLLLIACANVAGLLLARGVSRRSEFAVRAALGATRARLARQVLAESVLLSAAAGGAGIALSIVLQRVLPAATGLAARGVSASGLDWPVLLFAAAISIAIGAAAGVAPALRGSASRPATDLSPGARTTDARRGTRLRSVLVAAQVALSLFLLVGAGLLVRSLARLTSVDLGFDPRQVLTGRIQLPYAEPERRVQFLAGLRDEVAALPAVSAVSSTSHVPIRDPFGDPPVWAEGRPPADSTQIQSAALRLVLPGYFDTLRIPLRAGRDLAETDTARSPSVLVINETMARRLFPDENPIGRRVIMPRGGQGPLALEVVGVVGDARIYSVGARPPMTMYATLRQMPPMGSNLVVRTEVDPQRLAGAVRRLVEARDRDVAIDSLNALEATIGESLVPERVMTIMLATFSIVALLLASLGLYGVLSYHVTARRHEIGVRMALGAEGRDILRDVLARSSLMVLPGLALGIAAALAGTRLMAGLLYEVPANDPFAIAAAMVTLAAVALGASALPAWRAARVNPVHALRGE